MCEPNGFYLRVFTFGFTEKALFQVIVGLCMKIERKGAYV